jgi:endogenous inhibitor of DNA gyrase (YacG/DUF329 family)
MSEQERKCPICGREVVGADEPPFPFCSERCKAVDLHNWLSGEYQPESWEEEEENREQEQK